MVQNNYDKVIKDIALTNFVDTRVCKEIINSPFAYLKYMVTSASEEEGVRLPYVGAFCQKGNYKNKTMRTSTRKNILLENIVDVAVMMSATLGFELPTIGSFKDVIEDAFKAGDYEKINMIWDGWVQYNK
jgi:hypothetical protein